MCESLYLLYPLALAVINRKSFRVLRARVVQVSSCQFPLRDLIKATGSERAAGILAMTFRRTYLILKFREVVLAAKPQHESLK